MFNFKGNLKSWHKNKWIICSLRLFSYKIFVKIWKRVMLSYKRLFQYFLLSTSILQNLDHTGTVDARFSRKKCCRRYDWITLNNNMRCCIIYNIIVISWCHNNYITNSPYYRVASLACRYWWKRYYFVSDTRIAFIEKYGVLVTITWSHNLYLPTRADNSAIYKYRIYRAMLGWCSGDV